MIVGDDESEEWVRKHSRGLGPLVAEKRKAQRKGNDGSTQRKGESQHVAEAELEGGCFRPWCVAWSVHVGVGECGVGLGAEDAVEGEGVGEWDLGWCRGGAVTVGVALALALAGSVGWAVMMYGRR